jgi:hypothetical protein
METMTRDRTDNVAKRQPLASSVRAAYGKALRVLLLASGIVVLSSCGGGGSSSVAPIQLSLSGNWQFTMAPPADGSFLGGLEGGFLLQDKGSVNGGATYSVSLLSLLVPCNTGSATVTGTLSGQTVSLTAVAGTQTFALNGTLSFEGGTMAGTYSSTAGTASNGSPCGTAQAGLQWSASFVPPLMGSIQGTFHSSGGATGLNEQVFLVSGGLNQAANTGASSAAVTGNLSFFNPITSLSDYPCFTSSQVYGQISGNSVALQLTAPDGTEWGLIGEPVNSLGSTGVNPVTFDSVHGGFILHGAGPSYLVATDSCPGSLGNVEAAGDFGDVCLGLNGAGACQQPITLNPSALIFEPQQVGSPPSTQTVTLANASGGTLGSVSLSLANESGMNNYAETDDCALNGLPSLGQPFNLVSGQSCHVSILFSPLETCAVGMPPDQCPSPLTATITVASPSNQMIFTAPITGTGFSGDTVSGSRLHFSAGGVLDANVRRLAECPNRNRPGVGPATSPTDRALLVVGDHAEID